MKMSWKGKSRDTQDLLDEIQISGFFRLKKSRDPRIQQNHVPEIPELKILDPDIIYISFKLEEAFLLGRVRNNISVAVLQRVNQ